MALDVALLSTQHYKVRIKCKVEQSREWSGTLSLHFGVVAIEKRTFESLMGCAKVTYHFSKNKSLGSWKRRVFEEYHIPQSIQGNFKKLDK